MFRVGSLREAARLAEAIAEVPGLEGSGALLTLADDGLTVRLNRDLWQLEPHHVDLARAVSAVAKAHGAVADRAAVQEVQLAIAAKPDAIDVDFWRAALGYSVRCSGEVHADRCTFDRGNARCADYLSAAGDRRDTSSGPHEAPRLAGEGAVVGPDALDGEFAPGRSAQFVVRFSVHGSEE